MIEKRWIYHPEFTPDQQQAAQELAESLKITEYLATLLVQRGIADFEQSSQFFRPELSQLHDPFLMMDMETRCRTNFNKAIANGEKILIYGDYDVDGTTSVTYFMDF